MIGQLDYLGYALPEIACDGIFFNPEPFCVQETSNPSFLNLNVFNDDTLGAVLTDLTPYICPKTLLSEVVFTPY